ncbi:hypothetical protein [Pseudomonas sp. Sample_24]|uniref:hypothetical protein n=1 Tax=Pseudomonas sp. Sample_24 TaxID=2448268 RepID=UPI001032AD14|nr:hypothetical protein [Pseudomonas sp. Sample_24]
MRILVANKLFALLFLSSTAFAGQASNADSFPHMPVMSHETMTRNGKVIYEADVDIANPSPKEVALKIKIDDFAWDCNSTEGHVVFDSRGQHSGGNLISGYMIGCVVRDIKADGTATVDILYDMRDPSRGVNKSEHINATIKAGQRYESKTESGARIAMLLQPN